MLDIHIQPTDDEQYQKVLDTLRPMGVRLVTGEADPLVAALFYVALINTKLDNLGQLRHLHKVGAGIDKMTDAVISYNEREKRRHDIQTTYNVTLFHALSEKYGINPFVDDKGRKIILTTDLGYLTSQQIRDLFPI